MVSIGLLFRWINVVIIASYALYYCTTQFLVSLRSHIKDKKRKHAERLRSFNDFKQQRIELDTATEQQRTLIEQLTSKIDQWQSYEMQSKKKLQITHSKIYYDAKKRIEQQTQFLTQRATILQATPILIDATKKQLLATINQAQQKKYMDTILVELRKDIHGL